MQPSTDTVHMNVTLQPSKERLNEVVVTGYGQRKASAKQNITFGTLEPAQGWTNFDDYIAENLKEPEEVKEKALSGDVELSFDVNEEGEAINIKVEKSLCDRCDEEAIRLLKAGPKWKKEKNKKGRITIHF
jgi:TonB family protein